MRGACFVLSVLLAGCAGGGSGEASGDSGGPSGDASFDGDVACAPISGSSPFGVIVHGEVHFDVEVGPAHPSAVDAMLLFPKGRVAGAPVILVGSAFDSTRDGFSTSTATLDDGLGTTGLKVSVGAPCPGGIDASLVGPSDGLVGQATIDLTAPLDGILPVTGATKLCAAGAVASKTTLTAPTTLGPTSAAVVTSDVRLDPATASTVRVLASGAPVAVDVDASSGILRIAPTTAFAPSAMSIEIDVSGVRDLLGRSLDPLPSIALAVPTDAVVDRAFDTPPPAGATFGTRTLSVDAGAMWWKPRTSHRLVDVIGLGSPTSAASKVHLRHRFDCPTYERAAAVRTIVSSDGAVQSLTVGCSTTFVDEIVSLTGAPPYYLVLETAAGASACSYPFGGADAAYVIDDLSFE